jgi:catalase
VTCDAIAIVVSEEGAAALAADAGAVQFVADAYAHLKAIGCTAEAKALLEQAHVEPGHGVVELGPDFIDAAGRRHCEREEAVVPLR